MNYRIIADSSADLLSVADVDFASVPLKIITDEKEYVDQRGLDVAGMLDDLEAYKGRSSSSCPNAADWIEAFGDAENIFCVTITSGLSGSCNCARMAAAEYTDEHADRKVFVIDTLSVGPEAVLIVERLRELIMSGESFEDIVDEIKEYQKSTHLLFALESLHNLANNGRVSPLVAKVAGVLDIRVVGKASNEGTLEIANKCRGRYRTLVAILDNMAACGYDGGRVRIHHCENEDAAKVLAMEIHKSYPEADIKIRRTRGLCSFYAERGGMLIGYEGAEK